MPGEIKIMYLNLYKLTLSQLLFSGFDSKFKVNIYNEHFPETLEKYTRFSKFTFSVNVMDVLMERLYAAKFAEIGKKIKQMLSNSLRLNFCYLKNIRILHPKIIQHILENKQKNKCVCIYEIIQSIIMKMIMKMKNRSHRYDMNRFRSRHGQKYSKHKKCLTMMVLICIK